MTTTTTKRILNKMFKENTGRALCDSGDAYGRQYERNQKVRDLYAVPDTIRAESNEFISISLNTFKRLVDMCDFEPTMDAMFKTYSKKQEDTYNLEDMESFAEMMNDGDVEFSSEPFTCNTCNEETSLDQTLQFTAFMNQDVEYIILQVHGGCDVRSGYSTPRIFSISSDSDSPTSVLVNPDLSVTCDCEHGAYSDDNGNTWYNHDDTLEIDIQKAWTLNGETGSIICKKCNSQLKIHADCY